MLCCTITDCSKQVWNFLQFHQFSICSQMKLCFEVEIIDDWGLINVHVFVHILNIRRLHKYESWCAYVFVIL